MSSFKISVNGKVFNNWKTARVSRTLDENAGKFSFTSSQTSLDKFPVRAGDAIKILIDGQPALTGFCDDASPDEAIGRHDIIVSGRDNTSDLIDSSMPDSVKSIKGPVSMQELAEKVIAALGANIEVVDNVGNKISKFTKDEKLGAAAGKRCMEYLTNFARKKQVYLITDGEGRLVIFRPLEKSLPGSLTKGVNIKSSNAKFNHAQRFHTYSVRSQLDLLSGEIDFEKINKLPKEDQVEALNKAMNIRGIATDEKIRPSRFFEIQSEESMTKKEAENRAIEELNIRIARSEVYVATVVNALRSEKTLWDIGQLTNVNDESAGTVGYYIIRSVVHAIDRQSGSITTITTAPPEAYNVRIPNGGDTRRANQGEKFQTLTLPPKRGIR